MGRASPTPSSRSDKKRKTEDASGDEAEDKPKAKKTSRGNHTQQIISCLECRRMKWKCDRDFPCANCRKRGLESMCPDGRLNGAKADRQMVVSLQERIAELEASLQAAQQKLAESSTSHLADQRPSTSSTHLLPFVQTTPQVDANGYITPEGEGTRRRLPLGAPKGALQPGEDHHGSLTLGDEPGASTFFGNAGAAYLINVMERGNGQTGETRWNGNPGGDSNISPFIFDSGQTSLEALRELLPERNSAERLIQVYFKEASVLSCIVQEDSFTQDFVEPIYNHQPDTKLNNHRMAVLFLVIAIGAQLDTSLPPYNELGDACFRLSRSCLAYDPSGSVTFVQAICLMSSFLMNSARSFKLYESFWPVLGMGVRVAQQIGLHRCSEKWALEVDEIKLRRLVFWEVHTEDVMQSLTQGRPRLVQDRVIDASFPSGADLPNAPLSTLFHNYKYRLTAIYARINDIQTTVEPTTYRQTLEIDKQLRQFQADLPRAFHQPPNNAKEAYQILMMKVLISKGFMFLHRAYFARALRDHPREPLQSPFRYSYVSELESSRLMLSIARDALALNMALTSRMSIFFFHALTATVNLSGTVILSPMSSLANAVYGQLEEGVELFNSLQEGHAPRDILPTLRRLLNRARNALTSHVPSQDPESVDLLGINTTLHRVKTRKTQNPINTPSHFAHNPFDLLPITLADAVAVQDDLFSLPFELNDVQAEHPTIFDISNNTIPVAFPDGGRTVAENAVAEDLLDMRGNFGDVTGQDQLSMSQGYGLGTPGSSDLDFDALFADLGMAQMTNYTSRS